MSDSEPSTFTIAAVQAESTGQQCRDDLEDYLRTPDAREAEFWQLQALASIRRGLGRAMSPVTYARLRAVLTAAALEARS